MTAARSIRPACGFFRLRLVAGGPWVPARISRPCHCTVLGGAGQVEHPWTDACDRFPPLLAEIAGREPATDAATVERVWTGQPVEEAEWRRLVAVAGWARDFAPDAPEATPERAIDRLTARVGW